MNAIAAAGLAASEDRERANKRDRNDRKDKELTSIKLLRCTMFGSGHGYLPGDGFWISW